MNVSICYNTLVTIVYDDTFYVHTFEDHGITIDNLIETMKADMSEYNFTSAYAFDKVTGEILVEISWEEG